MGKEFSKKVQIIAEAGVNHNGDIGIAKELIKHAKDAGADYVKFQTFRAEDLVTSKGELAEYQKRQVKDYKNQLEMLKQLELSREDHIELDSCCKDLGIQFLSTPFELKSLNLLIELGLKLIKVSSGDLTNYFLLKKIASHKLSVILSTGMANNKEIGDALDCLQKNGLPKDKITVLHCTTEYPCPANEVNLLAMKSIEKEFGVKVGYSDHTNGLSVSLAAVALGATIIEKHFTLDRSMPGPDHQASLEPEELKRLVLEIRTTSSCLGDGLKSPTKSEFKNIEVARKSLVASKRISKGEIFTYDNLTSKRPGSGLSPMLVTKILGKKSKHNFEKDDKIVI